MQAEQAEIPELAKGFKVKLLVDVVLLNPGNDLFFGKADDFLFKQELFFGEGEIHSGSYGGTLK
jgi:hypothetical protein